MKYLRKLSNVSNISAAVALLGCAVSSSVLAQSSGNDYLYDGRYDRSWYIAPSINVSRPDKRFGIDHHGEGAGLRFGKAISPAWDIQFGPSLTRQRFGGIRYQQNTLGVDGLYMFSRDRFRPFLLLGAGAEYDKVNRRNFRADHTSPYVNAGVGFQLSFNDRWGMQADVRRAHSYLRGNEFGFDRANTNLVTVGLTYNFDKRAAPIVRMAPAPASPAIVAVAPEPTPVIVPSAPVTAPPPPPRFERFTLSATELFGFDSAELRMPQRKLDEIADALNRNAQVSNVTVTGYTDRLGSDAYNLKLSQRRADSVKAYLTSKGVAASRLTSVGKGESNPVVTCTERKLPDLIKCLEPNRRVEVEQIVIERRVQ